MRSAWRTTTTGIPRGRRRLGLTFLVAAPVLVRIAVMVFGGSASAGFNLYVGMISHAILGLVLPLTMIFLGTATFGDEWAGGTAHYVVGLPVSRFSVVLGRWLACVQRGLSFVLPVVLLLYGLTLGGLEGGLMHYIGELAQILAVVIYLTGVYAALFLLAGLALKRAVMISVVYVFLFEIVASNLPQSFAVLSLGFHGRNILWQLTDNDGFRSQTLNIMAVEPLGMDWSVFWIGVATMGALLLSTIVLSMKETGGESAASDAAES